MSTYSQYGNDVLFGGVSFKKTILGKIITRNPVVSAVKFVAHPIKETKAAIKTIARFDPTSKTAKYGNVTKGVLAASALAGAALLTGGTALAVAGGLASAAGTGLKLGMTPVRKPVSLVTPPLAQGITSGVAQAYPLQDIQPAPLNSFVSQSSGGGASGAAMSESADPSAYSGSTMLSAPPANKNNGIMMISVFAAVGAVVYFASRKKLA